LVAELLALSSNDNDLARDVAKFGSQLPWVDGTLDNGDGECCTIWPWPLHGVLFPRVANGDLLAWPGASPVALNSAGGDTVAQQLPLAGGVLHDCDSGGCTVEGGSPVALNSSPSGGSPAALNSTGGAAVPQQLPLTNGVVHESDGAVNSTGGAAVAQPLPLSDGVVHDGDGERCTLGTGPLQGILIPKVASDVLSGAGGSVVPVNSNGCAAALRQTLPHPATGGGAAAVRPTLADALRQTLPGGDEPWHPVLTRCGLKGPWLARLGRPARRDAGEWGYLMSGTSAKQG